MVAGYSNGTANVRIWSTYYVTEVAEYDQGCPASVERQRPLSRLLCLHPAYALGEIAHLVLFPREPWYHHDGDKLLRDEILLYQRLGVTCGGAEY
jgi:hypothetical protein